MKTTIFLFSLCLPTCVFFLHFSRTFKDEFGLALFKCQKWHIWKSVSPVYNYVFLSKCSSLQKMIVSSERRNSVHISDTELNISTIKSTLKLYFWVVFTKNRIKLLAISLSRSQKSGKNHFSHHLIPIGLESFCHHHQLVKSCGWIKSS